MKKHELLMELIQLREKDYDLFINRFYEAITNEFHDVFVNELLKEKEHQKTLWTIIKYFESKEQYEKCQLLFQYLDVDS
jgi:hypothetical protein